MQKIAIPVLNHKLCPHFASSLMFQVFHVNGQLIVKEYSIQTPTQMSESLTTWIANKDITDIIARGIEYKDIDFFNQHKINVFVGVKLETPSNLVYEYIDGTLETHDNLHVQSRQPFMQKANSE